MRAREVAEIDVEEAEAVSMDDVADRVCAELGIERPVRRVPEPEKIAA